MDKFLVIFNDLYDPSKSDFQKIEAASSLEAVATAHELSVEEWVEENKRSGGVMSLVPSGQEGMEVIKGEESTVLVIKL